MHTRRAEALQHQVVIAPDQDFVPVRLRSKPRGEAREERFPRGAHAHDAALAVALHVPRTGLGQTVARVYENVAHRQPKRLVLVVRVGDAHQPDAARWQRRCSLVAADEL